MIDDGLGCKHQPMPCLCQAIGEFLIFIQKIIGIESSGFQEQLAAVGSRVRIDKVYLICMCQVVVFFFVLGLGETCDQ